MSTIEKAVDKLERARLKQDQADHSVEHAADTLEKVVSREAAGEAVLRSTPPSINAEAEAVAEVVGTRATHSRVTGGADAGQPSSDGSRPGREILVLPLAALAERGMLTPRSPRSRIAEEFRTIKRPLLRNIDGATAAEVDNANLIMVTSALEGDGKTFTAINLALSIAMEQDKTVLFVDADVAKASAGHILGVPSNSPGLIDVLEEKGVTLADTILQTDLENLRVLPAGNVHERCNELLASQAMKRLMVELSNRYSDRVIVFDSPPLLLTTEASVLTSFMGQIAFVVSTDETPREAITEALEHIGEDKIIGMVLNKAHGRRNNLLGLGYAYGYGYGYGYGDGYGYGYGQGPGRRPAPVAESA